MKIHPYNRLLNDTELGKDAELTLDGMTCIVGDMTLREMLVSHDHRIRAANHAVLSSEEIGTWKWNKDRKKWEKEA